MFPCFKIVSSRFWSSYLMLLDQIFLVFMKTAKVSKTWPVFCIIPWGFSCFSITHSESLKNVEHKVQRFMQTSKLASSAPRGQTGAGIETNAYIENGPTCKGCDCKLSIQKGCTDVCQYRCTKETAHNIPCNADCAISGLVLQNQAG